MPMYSGNIKNHARSQGNVSRSAGLLFPEYREYDMIVGNFKKEEHYDEFVWTGFFETAGFFY